MCVLKTMNQFVETMAKLTVTGAKQGVLGLKLTGPASVRPSAHAFPFTPLYAARTGRPMATGARPAVQGSRLTGTANVAPPVYVPLMRKTS